MACVCKIVSYALATKIWGSVPAFGWVGPSTHVPGVCWPVLVPNRGPTPPQHCCRADSLLSPVDPLVGVERGGHTIARMYRIPYDVG